MADKKNNLTYIDALRGVRLTDLYPQNDDIQLNFTLPNIPRSASDMPQLVSGYGYSNIPQIPDYGNSKFDKLLPTLSEYENYQDIRAAKQSGIAQLGQGLTKLVTTAATTVVDDIAGTLYGLGQGIVNAVNNGWNTYLYQDENGKTYNSRDGYDLINGNILDANGNVVATGGREVSSYNNLMDGFVNNDISRALHTFNDKMREWMPTYTSSQYEQNREDGRWWRNMGSSAWWADMLENTGFMVGTAVAMMAGPKIPYLGRGINAFSRESLNTTRDVISKATKVALDEADDVARTALRGVSDLSTVPEDIIKASKQLHAKNVINTIQGSAVAAMGESRLEALGAGDQIAAKGNEIEENYQQIMQNVDQEVQAEHPEWFDMIEFDGNEVSVPNEQAREEIERRKAFYTQQRNSALDLIANQAKSLSNHVFGWNMAVLTLSNALAFNQFMNPGQQWMRMNTKSVTGESFRNVAKRLEQQGMSKDAIKTEIKRLRDIEKANKEAIKTGKFVNGKFEKGVDLQANWWQTRGKNIGRALLSPTREGLFEEMGQGIAQEAANYSAASKLNEFYGYTFDKDGLDESVSWINALSKGFNRTYFDPKGWEQGVMGALTAIVPLPMMGFRVSRNKAENGKKKFDFTMTNEFWHNLTSKEDYDRAKELARQYNELYNDPNGANMAIVNALARAEGLNKQYQDAIDNDDTYSIIGINNKKFWNLVTLYNKLGRTAELESLLNEIENTDTEVLGRQVLEAYKAEELDGYVDKSQLDPVTIGEKVKDNAKQYQGKLKDYLDIEKNIYNLYGSEGTGSLNEEYLTELSFITANIKSLEDRWKEILQNTPESLTNVLYTLLNTRQLGEQEGEVSELISKFINSKNEFEDLSTLTASYKNNSIIKAIDTVLSKVNDTQLDSDSTMALNSIKDLTALLQDRAAYIDRLNKLAKNPQAFSDAAKQNADAFMKNLREANVNRVVEALKNISNLSEFEDALEQLNTTGMAVSPSTLKEALKQLTEQGNTVASELYKSNHFINLMNRDFSISQENPAVLEEAERMFGILQTNAEDFEQLTNTTSNPLLMIQEEPTDPEERKEFLGLYNQALELLTNLVNKNKGLVNTSLNSSEVGESITDEVEEAEENDLDSIEIEDGTFDFSENPEGQQKPKTFTEQGKSKVTQDNANDNTGQEIEILGPENKEDELIDLTTHPENNKEYDVSNDNTQPEVEDRKEDDNNSSSTDFKGAYMGMQEFNIVGKNIRTFQRQYEVDPRYKTLYDFLKDTLKVFDNVDGKNPNVRIEAGTRIYFGISPKLDENIKAANSYEGFSVLMFVKDGKGVYHCVGNLTTTAIKALGLEASLKDELKDSLNDTTSDFIVSKQYSTVEKILTGVVKMRGTDYKSLQTLLPTKNWNNQKLAIIKGGKFVIGNTELDSQIVPINHSFPDGAAVLLLPTMAYDKTKSLENQPARAFFPVILKKNYFSFSQVGNITAAINGIISKIPKITTARGVDELAFNLKHKLLTDYMLSEDTQQTLHVNPMGWQEGKMIEIDRDDERIKKSGRTYNEMPVSAIKLEVRHTTTDENGNRTTVIPDGGSIIIQLRDVNKQPITFDENIIKNFIENVVRAKYQIDKDAIVDTSHVLDLINNNALSTNVESPEMLEVKANSFKLTAMSPSDIKSESAQSPTIDNATETGPMTEEEIKNFEEGIINTLKELKDNFIKWEDAFDALGIPKEIVARYPKVLASFVQQQWDDLHKPSNDNELSNLLDDEDKLSDEAKTPQRERYTEESLKRELNNLAKMLPNLTEQQRINLINDLIPVVRKGQYVSDAGGMFSRGIITLSKHAMIGTAYHEAFHAVFGLMLTNDEKSDILESAKKVWNNLSNIELEEKLAEGFREYSMTRDEYGLGEKIVNFFKRLLGIIDNWEDIQPVFNDLYRNIYEGKYGNRIIEANYSQEMVQIKQKAIADGTFMKAPNGNPTNLNERQWLQVRTKAFKNWFGDWTKITFNKGGKILNIPDDVSKVVDENGEPLVVYHGSYDIFNIFDTSKKRYNVHDKGFFFTTTENKALKYGPNIIAAFLNIKNIGYSEYKKEDTFDKLRDRENIILNNSSYDGVKFKTIDKEGFGAIQYAVYNPNQIKSATDNVGSFSRENDDIRYSIEQRATISTRNGVPVWISPDGSLVKELTPKAFQVTVDSLVNNNAYNRPYSSNSEIKSQTMNRWGLWKDQKYREGIIVEGKWNAKKKGIELTKVELDNPTTLSDASYASLSSAEREIARNCHSR